MTIADDMNFEKQRDRLLEITSDKMNAKNPTLIKTGTIATFVNITQHLQQDSKNFYSQLLRELNPALAQDTSSLLFHASVEEVDIGYAQGAILSIDIIVPEIDLRNTEMYEYTIQKGNRVVDTNGLIYTFDSTIKINLGAGNASAKNYSAQGVENLSVKRIQNPDNNSQMLYLINFAGLRQYQRTFQTVDIGTTTTNIELDVNKNKLQNLYVWLILPDQLNSSFYLDEDELAQRGPEDIGNHFNWTSLNIKNQKYTSSYNDHDIFLELQEDGAYLIPGDNIYGKSIPIGSKLIIETQSTEGMDGNISEGSMVIDSVISEFSVNGDSNSIQELMSLQAISLNGSGGGKGFDDNEIIREKILDKRVTKNSITSLKDYELFFKIENSKPFVTTKFFNSKTHVFVYNVLKYKNHVVKTNTMHVLNEDLEVNPFYPTTNYKNADLISPFYYKRTTDGWKSYAIDPKVKIKFRNEEFDDNKLTTLNYIEAYLMYDFDKQLTYIQLENMNEDYTYVFNSNINEMVLNKDNNFRVDAITTYLDGYCLLMEPLRNISMSIIKDDSTIVTFVSENSYYQLDLIQTHYLYQELDKYNTNNETVHVLNIPYVSKSFYDDIDYIEFYQLIKGFFKVKEHEHLFSFNTSVNQLFYNTISVEEEYTQYILEENSNGSSLTTENNIVIEFVINKNEYIIEGFSDLASFEYRIIRDILPLFIVKEGFHTRYYETEIENFLKNKYNNLIENVRLLYPGMFIIHDNNTIHGLMENDLVDGKITLMDIINFTPPYFYYNYDNISIDVKFK